MAEKKMKGTVKWFSARRGYGFITDEDGIDYFVHYSEIQREGFKKLFAKQNVAFEAAEDSSGRSLAKSVEILPREPEETEDTSEVQSV